MINFCRKAVEIRYSHLNYGAHIVEEYCKVSNYQNVLDIGCGWGRDLFTARRFCDGSVTLWGVDFSGERKGDLEKIGIKPIILDLERDKIPLASNSIDLVIANQVYEHLKEIFWTSHEIARVLRVGARIILGVPNLASFHNRLYLLQVKIFEIYQRRITEIPEYWTFQACILPGFKLLPLPAPSIHRAGKDVAQRICGYIFSIGKTKGI